MRRSSFAPVLSRGCNRREVFRATGGCRVRSGPPLARSASPRGARAGRDLSSTLRRSPAHLHGPRTATLANAPAAPRCRNGVRVLAAEHGWHRPSERRDECGILALRDRSGRRVRRRPTRQAILARARRCPARARRRGRRGRTPGVRERGLAPLPLDVRRSATAPRRTTACGADAVRHWSSGPVATHRCEPVEPLPNILAQVAACQPLERALVVWESAVRTRRIGLEVLRRLPMRGPRARSLLDACSELSDSGIETIPALRLRRIGIPVRQQVAILGHLVDGLIGDRLVYQIDGFAHHRTAAQRRRDIAHDRRLALAGFTVLRFDYAQIMFDWPAVELEIRTAMAQRLHLAS